MSYKTNMDLPSQSSKTNRWIRLFQSITLADFLLFGKGLPLLNRWFKGSGDLKAAIATSGVFVSEF